MPEPTQQLIYTHLHRLHIADLMYGFVMQNAPSKVHAVSDSQFSVFILQHKPNGLLQWSTQNPPVILSQCFIVTPPWSHQCVKRDMMALLALLAQGHSRRAHLFKSKQITIRIQKVMTYIGCIIQNLWLIPDQSLYIHCAPPKPGTIMANNFHKLRPISMPFDRIVPETLVDNLP